MFLCFGDKLYYLLLHLGRFILYTNVFVHNLYSFVYTYCIIRYCCFAFVTNCNIVVFHFGCLILYTYVFVRNLYSLVYMCIDCRHNKLNTPPLRLSVLVKLYILVIYYAKLKYYTLNVMILPWFYDTFHIVALYLNFNK